jgi:crotonobetainyl-CoA:carnitine CoA-transferase CaiB-like acyl-CoA transferase
MGPLEGLRVVDCSRGMAGPRLGGILADYGADVIWIEPPGGDPGRECLAAAYSVFNRGKRSVVLDVHHAVQRPTVLDLIATADVFVESFAPGGAARVGLDFDAIRERAPWVVHCSITGFGSDGPLRDIRGYESMVHALVGTMGEQPGHRQGPVYSGLGFASIGAAYIGLIGILAALYRGHTDGWGRHVEASLLDGALSYFSMMWGDTDKGAAPFAAGTYRLVTKAFRCADDLYLGVHTGAVGAFGRLMNETGLHDRVPGSADGLDMGLALTAEEIRILDTELPVIFASRPRAEWVQRLMAADVCAIEHLPSPEVFDQPQARHNQMVVMVDDPVLGPVEQVAPPAKFGALPTPVERAAPRVGEHTAEVLAEVERWAERDRPTGSPDTRPLLDGVHILDLGAYYAGPYSSRLLADLGADVIKLEPVAGDPVRGLARPFRSASAGKRSLSVNMKDPEVSRLASQLLSWADIVHHNMRPGAAERLGLGWDQFESRNPAGIYVYAPGWGSSGPHMLRQSFAPLMSGYVGVGLEVAGQHNPPLFPVGNEDPGNGMVGAAAMLMGLLHRQRTGRGGYVENPQLNATMAHMAHVVRRADGTAIGSAALDPLQMGFGALDRLYETSDGWILVVAATDVEIDALSAATGVAVRSDDRFATYGARVTNDYELETLLRGVLATRSTAHWSSALAAAAVPAAVPVAYNNSVFMRDPENLRTRRVAAVPHRVDGTVHEVDQLVRVSDAAVVAHRIAPELGEHTAEILTSLGVGPERLQAMFDRKAGRQFTL